MGLSTVMNTALSGMNAAATLVEISADNLANSQTPGFKAARARLATLPPQDLLLGAPPTGGSAGTGPIQIGSGVQLAATDCR
jgi:flagellar hook protein FlgE